MEDYKINERAESLYHPSTESTDSEQMKEYEEYDWWKQKAIKEGRYILLTKIE